MAVRRDVAYIDPPMKRFFLSVELVAVLAAFAGCGGGDDKGTAAEVGRSSPNTQGVLLTVLSYGRAESAKEACPLVSKGYAAKLGGGDAKKCASGGTKVLCPCTSESLQTSKIEVNGDTATATATRANGTVLDFTLVREGSAWKIDSLKQSTA
jgi:hypothetical protein